MTFTGVKEVTKDAQRAISHVRTDAEAATTVKHGEACRWVRWEQGPLRSRAVCSSFAAAGPFGPATGSREIVNASGGPSNPLAFTISRDPYRAQRGAANELVTAILFSGLPRGRVSMRPLRVLRASATPVNVISVRRREFNAAAARGSG